uniref:DUF19 domain-containing protein n=1 Tax=Rhabditophanes sp. KR3021 TaxID=114890 RepID=A0AC35TU83_9BILA
MFTQTIAISILIFATSVYSLIKVPAVASDTYQDDTFFPTERLTSTIKFKNCSVYEQSEIKKCAGTLYDLGFFDEDFDGFSWHTLVVKARSYFGKICDNFLNFNICIEPYKLGCLSEEPARERFEFIVNLFEFLCKDGYTEVTKNLECFQKTMTRSEMMQCQAEMLADTNRISSQIPEDGIAKDSAVCGAMRNYVDCVRYPVKYECGYRAWQNVREIIVKPLEVIMPQCEFNSVNTKSLPIFIILCTLMISLLL